MEATKAGPLSSMSHVIDLSVAGDVTESPEETGHKPKNIASLNNRRSSRNTDRGRNWMIRCWKIKY